MTKFFTSKDGTRIACEVTGKGPSLVLVHGTTADHTRFAPILPALGEHFTVYACDRRGRGLSGDAAAYALEREFEDVAAVVDGLGGEVDLLGHSYGALCSLEGAALSRNLRRLVLYEPPIPIGAPITPPGIVERLEALLEQGDHEGVVTTFVLEVPKVPPAGLEKMREKPAWKARVAAAATIPRELRADDDYRLAPERLRALRVPTLLLLGGDSPPFFREALEQVKLALPQAELVVLPGQQHVAIDTAPELFSQEVIAFLTRPSEGRSEGVTAPGPTREQDVAALHDAYVAAWLREDPEAAMAFWSEDIVMHAPGRNPHSGTYRGKPSVKQNLIDRIYAETKKAEVLGLDERAIGQNRVFTVVHERFEKADSRVFETHRVVIYRWERGKIVEVSYFDPDQAAADAFWSERAATSR